MTRVIVGIDGSSVSHQALAFAAKEARLRGATLQVVHVRQPAPRPARMYGVEYAPADVIGQMIEVDRQQARKLEDEAREASERVIATAIATIDADAIDLEMTTLVDRRPARMMVEFVGQFDDAEMLVVGSRGRGELTGMLLGSVSLGCVTHAHVPVTVVHADGG